MAEPTIGDIVDAAQEQRPLTEEQLRLALLAVFYHAQMACSSDYASKTQLHLEMRAKDNFERHFRLLKADPATWLGPRWTPGTQENAEGRTLSKRVLAAFERSKKP
jgi:hypothetical protein